jgi:hypothetical protein
MKIALVTAAILTLVCGLLLAQVEQAPVAVNGENPYTASVRVLAFEAGGAFLGAPEVRVFESWDHKDLAGAFHAGIAEGVPFGVYKLEAHRLGCVPETRYVSVFRKRVTVIVGLAVSRETNGLPVWPALHGKVTGALPPGKKAFVRLVGVYSSQALESSIDSDGGFDFSVPQYGLYVLLVVNEDGVLASRIVSNPYSGPPLEIQVGPK